MLVLEGAQAGLSWSTILHKRENYRRAFAGFDAEQQHRAASEALGRRVVEIILGPVDAPREPVHERDHRPRRLEIVELLRLDRRELLRAPGLREIAARE